uniref:Rho-GAP domain-containing protein n=1 Tax=Biomphalaria glabrata TaxID=6526 RepID=A0A2C9M297_BIOGL
MAKKSLKHALSLPSLNFLNNFQENKSHQNKSHETPFSIKFNQLHETSKTKARDDRLRTSTSAAFIAEENPKCEFFIKQKKSQKKFLENTFQKSMKKTRRNFINNFLKRLRPAQPSVFGQALDNICDENHNPPDAIIKLMIWIYQYGPSKVGILRRGNNASIGKELREKIDNGIAFELDDSLTPTAASVFKEFIRHIPEGLMLKELHTEWIKIKIDDPDNEKIQQIKKVLDQLPPAHFNLLKMTMCLLQHLAKHSSFTQMGPSNLATCIAPSFFSHGASEGRKSKKEHENLEKTFHEITKFLTPLITFMINKHLEIFGEDVLTMFDKYGCKQSPVVHITEDKSPLHSSQIAEQEEESFDDEDMNNETKLKVQERPGFPDSNSGTDSDSLHSVLSLPTDTRSGIQQDTSSIDSLVDKEDFSNEIESSPTVIKSHLSPTNLSRDSGLTLSDTQLYDEDAGLDFTANFKVIKDSPVFSRALTPRRYYKNKSKERDKGLDSLNRTQKFMNNSSATSSDLTYSLGNDHMLTEDSHNEASFSPNHLYLSSQQHKMLTQTSVDESVSHVSTHASIISQSEEGSVHSAPQTPDDFHTRSLDWKANDSPNQLEIHESYFSLSNFSKSESNLKMESSEYDQNNEKKVLALKNDKRKVKRNWKSHEAEEVMTRRRYQPRLVLPPREISVDESSPSPSFAEPKTPLKHNIPVDHIKGSPPPNVILQSFHQSSHSNPHEIHKKAVSSSKSLDGVFMKDAIQKKSSFKINAHNFQSGQTPQDMQSVSQHVLGNCREPIEITEYEREKQKEISARAKAIYEDSLQKYYEKSETISSDVLFHVKKGQRPKMVQRDNLKPKDNNVIFDCSVESPSNSLLLKEESDKGSYSTLNQSMSDNPERLTLDSSAHISNTSNENVNLNVKKSPKELYLESIKQIQVTEGIPHNQMKGKLSLQSSLPNVFSKLPPNSSEQCSKPVSSDGPSIFKSIVNDLHRSQSDARDFKVKNQVSEKLNNKTVDENLQDVETEAINRSKEFEITSEDLHQNFLRAKNVFQTVSQQGKAERAYMSPTNPFKSSNERLLSKTSPLIGNYKIETLPPAQNKADANPLTASKFQPIEDPVLNSKHRVIETPLSASRHKSVSTIELSNLRDHDNISKTKAELPWSVKNLKSQWDKGSSKPLFSSNSFKTNSVSASQQNLSSLNSTKIIRDVDNKINPNNVTSASQQNLSSLNSSKIRDINNKINPNIYL